MSKYICTICGYIYDEDVGVPEEGIKPGTKWNELPENWVCPLCGAPKSDFELYDEAKQAILPMDSDMVELSFAQMSALCSNLAKACQKQYLKEESTLFLKLSDYYNSKADNFENEDFSDILSKIDNDLNNGYPEANQAAKIKPDRGALRALLWSEKVTKILKSLLSRYEKDKNSMLENTNIYVCEICGFIFIGDEKPEICPVCKVTNKKMIKVER